MLDSLETVGMDVLVIGGGAAAAMAAVEAARSGLAVSLLDKGRLGHSGATPLAGGGVAALLRGAGSPDADVGGVENSPELFVEDVMRNGCGICDPRLVRRLVEESGEAFLEAGRIGVPWSRRPDGSPFNRVSQGHGAPRVYPVVGGGPALMNALSKGVREAGVRVLDRAAVVKLLAADGRIVGALALDGSSGRWIAVRCKAVVLAAGGAAALYRYASSSYRTTGDAFALALDAGCRLANLEFVEFTLIPMVREQLIIMGGLGQFLLRGAQLRNAGDERFMVRYDPERRDLSTKALMSRAVYEEIVAGRGPVRMDVSCVQEDQWADLRDKSPHMFARLEHAGWRPPSSELCWTPAAHFSLGGIVIDEEARSSVEGLFAAGECANGVHGAERMGGNALLECLVFGRIAGRSASRCASLREASPWHEGRVAEEVSRYRSRLGSVPARGELDELLAELQEAAWEGLGVVRDEAGLVRCEERLRRVLGRLGGLRVADHRELLRWLELCNLATVGVATATPARVRTESRGAHQRRDYPETDEGRWRRWIVLTQREGDLHMESRPSMLENS